MHLLDRQSVLTVEKINLRSHINVMSESLNSSLSVSVQENLLFISCSLWRVVWGIPGPVEMFKYQLVLCFILNVVFSLEGHWKERRK